MRTDDVLGQIDNALDDWDVSGDAMRWGASPTAPPAVRPRMNGANVLIGRLIERHGLTPAEAQAAVVAAELGRLGPHADLAAREAQAVLAEMQESLRAAFQPLLQRVADQFRQIKEAFRHLPEAVGCDDCGKPPRPRDRPAWQTPYGPARKRR
jgi:hypothetical protein